MKTTALSAAIALALTLPVAGTALAASNKAAASTAAPAATEDEIRAVRAQLEALSERLQRLEQSNQQLEQQNAALKAENAKIAAQEQETQQSTEAQADALAKAATKANGAEWASRIKVSGDFRYRDEQIQRDLRADQTRDRIRARIGFTAKANDTLSVGARLTTGADDPRSPNQTIGAADTGDARRTIGLDQYFATWKPLEGLTVTGGKMPYPFFRPGLSAFNDPDINPEGLAVGFQQGIFFGNAFGFWLTERAASNHNPTTGVTSSLAADRQGTVYAGLQLGVKAPLGPDTSLTGALMYTSLGAGKGRIPYWFAGGSIPTTTTYVDTTTCQPAPNPVPPGYVPACTTTTVATTANNITAITQAANGNSVNADGSLKYDYHVTQASLEFNTKLGLLPLQVFADYAKNSGASDQDKAYTAGFLIGKAVDKNSWEFSYVYEKLEKDAYYGGFVDSDFGAGFTDSKGSAFRIGYAPAKNWSLNVTYLLNQLNVSGLSNVAVQSATLNMPNETYKRLDLDFNVKY